MRAEVFDELTRLRTAGVPFCLATVVRVEAPTSAKPGDKAIITTDGKLTGWIGGSCSETSIRREAQAALQGGEPRLVRIQPDGDDDMLRRSGEVVLNTTCPSGGTLEIFLEPQLARPQVIAIGHSPAVVALIRLAAVVGYRTCAVHPGAMPGDFPEADRVLPSLEAVTAEAGPDSWIVVATMGHYDEEALEAALRTQAAYVGLIASRRRRNAVVQVLRRRGWSGDALSGIVNPAGKTLGDTQEEIALSVLADIVARRSRQEQRGVEVPMFQAPVFVTDPICNMAVEIATAMYRSGDVYFCGPGCLAAYEAAQVS